MSYVENLIAKKYKTMSALSKIGNTDENGIHTSDMLKITLHPNVTLSLEKLPAFKAALAKTIEALKNDLVSNYQNSIAESTAKVSTTCMKLITEAIDNHKKEADDLIAKYASENATSLAPP